MSQLSEKEIIRIFQENNFKVTPQRLAICRDILVSKNHPSAEQIYKDIKMKYPTISKATVYKTLSLLRNIGLINELHINDTFTRYDPKTSVHINIVCPHCLNIYDYESEEFNEIWNNIISKIEGEVISQNIDVYSLCKKCREK